MMMRKPVPAASIDKASRPTPMIAQYQTLKKEHPQALLFFRMGDFYELFFEDAVEAAAALDIALTKRGRHEGEDIPMCGVPVHAAESYLERLIRRGYRVAICEQTESPDEARKRPGRSLVRREVVRIVTPGTLTEESLLEARHNNFLAAVARVRDRVGIAWADISAGSFNSEALSLDELESALARIGPGELLVPGSLRGDERLAGVLRELALEPTQLEDTWFDSLQGERRLCEQWGVATLDGFGAFERCEMAAGGALLRYLDETQRGRRPRLDAPKRNLPGRFMHIDTATRRSLEILVGKDGGRAHSLLDVIDRTRTGAGGRLLAQRLAAPLADPEALQDRLLEVEALATAGDLRDDVRSLMRNCPDLGRALGRLSLQRAGPRDLLAIARGLELARALRSLLSGCDDAIARLTSKLSDETPLVSSLLEHLVDEPPASTREGGFIRPEISQALDEQRALRDQSRRHIAGLELKYRELSGITSLKIRHNNMLGYYIEVSASHRDKVPEGFVQRQSMAGATRFGTNELSELEGRIAGAAEQALAIEVELFESLREQVLERAERISETAGALAAIDVTAALAKLAVECRYVRPVMTSEPAFDVKGGRHPIVEQTMRGQQTSFVANDCRLEADARLWLLTGPNMAGKSTFLRQNALIAVLAQSGSFVPADEARIGIVDRLYARVGAADDITRGRSTFMVEMIETAAILNQATERSLVILDEIGRGTATHDGLAIAWAVVEHLHDLKRCRGLFATHYHELTALASKLAALALYTVKVREWRGDVVFLHEVVSGGADRSYGLHVAKLAGLPAELTDRAQEVLDRLEAGDLRTGTSSLLADLPLFQAERLAPASGRPTPKPVDPSEVERRLRNVRPDDLSPKAALDLIYELHAILDRPTE